LVQYFRLGEGATAQALDLRAACGIKPDRALFRAKSLVRQLPLVQHPLILILILTFSHPLLSPSPSPRQKLSRPSHLSYRTRPLSSTTLPKDYDANPSHSLLASPFNLLFSSFLAPPHSDHQRTAASADPNTLKSVPNARHS
jgi:hypothetical protein